LLIRVIPCCAPAGWRKKSPEELELLLREVSQRIDQQKKVEAILDEYMGVVQGVRQTDAQEYVNEPRKEEEES